MNQHQRISLLTTTSRDLQTDGPCRQTKSYIRFFLLFIIQNINLPLENSQNFPKFHRKIVWESPNQTAVKSLFSTILPEIFFPHLNPLKSANMHSFNWCQMCWHFSFIYCSCFSNFPPFFRIDWQRLQRSPES